MCGIMGYVGPAPDMDRIERLAVLAGKRGPHASGWAELRDDGWFTVQRRVDSLDHHAIKIMPAQVIVGHSRLATTGGESYRDLRDAHPMTIPGGTANAAAPVLVHNGVFPVDAGEPCDTGCDSEALLRLSVSLGGLPAALALLPATEPYAVLRATERGLEAARRGLPLFALQDDSGVYLCSVPFEGAAALDEGRVHTFEVCMAAKKITEGLGEAITYSQGPGNQPLSRVEWIAPELLHANSYNPNHVAPVEMELLKLSIMEDGWTQPIVARPDGEIVDGFHRWTLGSTDKDVQGLTGGLVPVVRLRPGDEAHQMMSTIRHNRARGSHAVLKMADIVRKIVASGMGEEEIERRLGMEPEEVERLNDASGMINRGKGEGFNTGWVPEGSEA